MQLERDILTAEETLSIGEETLKKIIDKPFFDYKVGDQFFIKSQPDVSHVVLGDYYDEQAKEIILVYGNNQRIDFEEVYPLFTTGMLMELLSFAFPFNLSTFGHGWILLWNGGSVFQSQEGESLVSFLWRALAEVVESDKYVW